ncbi:DUF2934 domain-containing protein [Paraburkholderia sp. 40]|uniref:DUF2934 domain-containing protein n=1 Tax=unclassified Paraburkholderia TaxID=2615204 RepID=UPI003D199828
MVTAGRGLPRQKARTSDDEGRFLTTNYVRPYTNPLFPRYELWEKDDSPEGRADEYWEQARFQIDEEESEADGNGDGPKGRLPG